MYAYKIYKRTSSKKRSIKGDHNHLIQYVCRIIISLVIFVFNVFDKVLQDILYIFLNISVSYVGTGVIIHHTFNLDLAIINQQLCRAAEEAVPKELGLFFVFLDLVNQSCKPVYFINQNQL